MGMIQARDGFRLALKALAATRIIGEMLRKNLDGDGTFQAGIAGAVDLSHSARANRRKNLVRAKFCPSGQGHG